ncbi:hypothetical protein L1987_50227 [Smallanthus sonchifolius]|uniref:Uncharacterized protein n=1 Tax=Smallanthus sonchifolius TaxID=185202 RepID=A0ACB9EMI0_9ASTR|nr:hypothetical protein L1987_50227 [Smallanthus sonchifolius]
MSSHRVLNDVTNSHKKPTQPYAPIRKPSPNIPTPAITQPQPKNPAQPKPSGKKVTVQKPQSVSSQSFVVRDELKGIPTSNPFAALDVDMSDVDKNNVVASDDGDMSESNKFYEFSSESIANKLIRLCKKHPNPVEETAGKNHPNPVQQEANLEINPSGEVGKNSAEEGFGHSIRLCKKHPNPVEETAGKNHPNPVQQEANLEINPSGEVGKNSAEEGFVMVTRKHRRPKVKILSNPLGQNRGKKVINSKGPKSVGTPKESVPSSSSDPIIQKKMGELHQKFEKSKMSSHRVLNDVTNSHKKPTQPYAPIRKPSPNIPTPAITQPQPKNPAQPKPSGKKVTVQKPQSVSSQSFVVRDELKGIPTSNPFAALDVDMSDVDKNNVVASDDGDMSESNKFYEFSSESIANVLHFNPSKLNVPRLHDLSPDPDDPVNMDVACDDEIPDFNITNAQKQAISNSLVKYGAVKADDQVNWEHGEWEFFHYQVKLLNIDPETCIEDVDSDSNETAQFFKSQTQQGAPGNSVTQAHLPANIV